MSKKTKHTCSITNFIGYTLATTALLLTGCLHHSSTPYEFNKAPFTSTPTLTEDELNQTSDAISNEAQLLESIRLHRQYLTQDPSNRDLLTSLSNQIILKAAAYTTERKEKRQLYLDAMTLSELAMRQNPDFDARIQAGEQPWDAMDSLSEEDMDAMLFWVTGLLYIFKEGMIPGEQVFNGSWISRATKVLDHMETIDRTWRGGAVMFSRSIIDAAVPGIFGGDKQRAWAMLEEAVNLDGNWMLARWGRAKYFHTKAGNKMAFIDDLNQLLAIDAELPGEATYWRRYFHEDARAMLADIDQWFE